MAKLNAFSTYALQKNQKKKGKRAHILPTHTHEPGSIETDNLDTQVDNSEQTRKVQQLSSTHTDQGNGQFVEEQTQFTHEQQDDASFSHIALRRTMQLSGTRTKVYRSNADSYQEKVMQLVKTPLIVLFTFMFVIFTSLVSVTRTFSHIQTNVRAIPTPDEIVANLTAATNIVDRNGEQLFRLHGDESNAVLVDFNELHPHTIVAFLAAEDSEFFNHEGINPAAILRCAAKALDSGDLCGGSTITQQVVKILTKENAPTLDRKINEIFTATQLEDTYTKEEILELYFNVTPYGSNIRGLKTAALSYFNIQDVSQLSLAQSVSLAAIINDPVFLAPSLSEDPEATLARLNERRNYIFDQITEKKEALNSVILQLQEGTEAPYLIDDLILQNAQSQVVAYGTPKNDMRAGHFVQYVIDELQKRPYNNGVPFTRQELEQGGYRIITSLDIRLQEIAERYAYQGGTDYAWANVHNAAVLTIHPITGEVLVMAGSKSFTGQSEGCDPAGRNCVYDPEVNVLTTLQSPGSTNKSLAYMLAYEQGKLFPGSVLPDVPVTFGGYRPKNWDSGYLGAAQTARDMLVKSRNIPALIAMRLVGTEAYIDKAKIMGYTTYENAENFGISLALGGGDVYPVEHAQAYGVFANGGYKTEVNPILRIENAEGEIVYEAQPQPELVADPGAVYQLNQTLYNLETGTGGTIAWDSRDIAGKTGTTENNKDNLLVMYSPDFVTLGWVGNNNNAPLNFQWGWPGFTVAPWLKGYMAEATNTGFFQNRTSFSRPDSVYFGGGNCVNGLCRGLKADWLVAGKEPPYGDVRMENKTKTVEVAKTNEEGETEIVQETVTTQGRSFYIPIPEVQRVL